MIVRIWRGWTTKANAPAYERLFLGEILPSVTAGVSGYRDTRLLKREVGEEIEFTTMFFFDSMEAVRAFAGDHMEEAVVPESARALLSRFDSRVQHHELVR